MRADVAIVGAGPAGGAAALQLASTGYRVVILEQCELPRAKACGGLIPARALERLPVDVSHLVAHRVSGRHYSYQHGETTRRSTPDSPLALVDRCSFDAGLVSLAIELGKGNVELLSNFRVSRVTEGPDSVLLMDDRGQQVEAKYLLAADGPASLVARSLGLNQERRTAAGIDCELTVKPGAYRLHSEQVLFDYFCLPTGYGWIFPKADNLLSLGVAAWPPSSPSRSAMTDFIDAYLPSGDVLESTQRACAIPVYSGSSKIASERACLLGDAASLVDPVTGEGIRYALESGTIAGEIVSALLDSAQSGGSTLTCGHYQQRIDEGIGARLSYLAKFHALPFREAPSYYYNNFVLREDGGAYK